VPHGFAHFFGSNGRAALGTIGLVRQHRAEFWQHDQSTYRSTPPRSLQREGWHEWCICSTLALPCGEGEATT
jgi:hypothetical protein